MPESVQVLMTRPDIKGIRSKILYRDDWNRIGWQQQREMQAQRLQTENTEQLVSLYKEMYLPKSEIVWNIHFPSWIISLLEKWNKIKRHSTQVEWKEIQPYEVLRGRKK